MDLKSTSAKAQQTIEQIKTLKGTVINDFLELEPKNDYEYLKLWFYYMNFLSGADDFIEDLIKYASDPDTKIFGHELHTRVKHLFESELKNKKENLTFEPRLEIYLAGFAESERDNLRILILAVLWLIKTDDLGLTSLLGIANRFHIPEKFIMSLSREHRIFTEKVVQLEKDDILGKGFFGKDIKTSTLVYNLFAGIPVGEMEMVELAELEVARFFDVITDDFLKSMPREEIDEAEEDFDWDDDEMDEDIESILSNLEEDIEEDPEQVSEEENIEEEEIKSYRSDADYFLAEFEYFKILAKIGDPGYSDTEEDLRQYPILAKRIKNKNELRLKKTVKSGFTPRFEKLAKEMRLAKFEKEVMKALICNQLFSFDDLFSISIGDLLKLLEENPLKRLENRKYFKKSAKLVKSGLVRIEEKWGISDSIMESDIKIDSRLIELLSGESFDISEYIDGTYLYSSGIKMKNVILPKEAKNKVLNLIENFDLIQKARKNVDFDKHFEYGNSLVMLFTGPSGTGKTMLANAISNELKKKILLFNLNNMAQLSSSAEDSAIFQTLFREARLNDAILFFDESEIMLQDRFNDLLIEIERHNGIVIFATNASFEIDPAMRRRILHFTNFKDPGVNLRKEIWKVHLYDFPKKLKLDNDIDIEYLASKYEISGGLIKNAIFTALVMAVNESKSDHPVISMEHLKTGAKEQLDNKFFMSKMEKVRIPHKGLESVVVSPKIRKTIEEVVNYEKARKVLEGQWGFSEVFPDKNGIAILFYGPPGTGKTLTAEAIAYETGKTLKQVNYAQIVSKWVGETEKALEALFSELADNKSILLFDEADALFAKRTEVSGSSSRYLNMETDLLLSLIERNNVFAILTTNNLENIDDAFYRRMTYIINFEKPEKALRKQLWQTLIPDKLPLKEEIDFELLAGKFNFTGAEIKNVIIRTATNKALEMEVDPGLNTQDFIEMSEQLIRPEDLDRKRVGFKS